MTNLMPIAAIARLLIASARIAWVQAAVPVSRGDQKMPLRVRHDR
jgi:hypothetical protein